MKNRTTIVISVLLGVLIPTGIAYWSAVWGPSPGSYALSSARSFTVNRGTYSCAATRVGSLTSLQYVLAVSPSSYQSPPPAEQLPEWVVVPPTGVFGEQTLSRGFGFPWLHVTGAEVYSVQSGFRMLSATPGYRHIISSAREYYIPQRINWRGASANIGVWSIVSAATLLGIQRWIRSRRHLPGCCQSCGYDLRGVRSPKCPECGVDLPEELEAGMSGVPSPAARP